MRIFDVTFHLASGMKHSVRVLAPDEIKAIEKARKSCKRVLGSPIRYEGIIEKTSMTFLEYVEYMKGQPLTDVEKQLCNLVQNRSEGYFIIGRGSAKYGISRFALLKFYWDNIRWEGETSK